MDSPRFHRPCWVHMVDGSSWVLLDPLCLRARGSYMGPRTLQNFHGLLLSYWTQGVPGCRDPTGSHWIPPDPSGSHWVPRAAVLVNPRCPRIPPDPTGCQWIPMGATGFHGPCWVHMVVGSSWVLLDPRCSGLDRPNWISATCCWFAAPMVIRAPGSRACCNAFHNGSYDFLASALSFPNGSYDFTAAVMASHKGSYVFCELQTGSHCKTKADP